MRVKTLRSSNKAYELIKKYEGLRLIAYKAVSTEKYYTIGYGHYGKNITKGMIITKETAESLLHNDIKKAENAVNIYNPLYSFNQCQYDALVSFAFNVGNIKQLTNNGKRTISQIANALPLYCKSGGVKLNGLVKRRNEELTLFLRETNELETVARQVLTGKWGNGQARKEALTLAGYDYKEIQSIVNKLLKEV